MRERFKRAGRGRPRKTSSATTIKQLSITRDQSSQWQLMAELPDAEFETLLARGEREGRIVTTAEIVRAARQRRGLQPKLADDPNYCRVIVRIREKTHQGVMDLLSTGYQSDNLSALVDDLLTQWLAGHEAKRPASSRKKTTESYHQGLHSGTAAQPPPGYTPRPARQGRSKITVATQWVSFW